MTTVLETRGLEKRFGGMIAVRNVSVSFKQGEVVGIIGANGAGKTTFVNLVTGHLVPTSGVVLLKGKDVTDLSSREMTRLGVLRSFQIPQLFTSMSVCDNLLLANGISDAQSGSKLQELRQPDRLRKCRELLTLYGIEVYADRIVSTVPQGVRKLLDIIMAGVGESSIFFLDEPTSGVSTDDRDALMQTVISNAVRQETTLLVIEHDMKIIRRFVHRVIAFYDGTIICDAPPSEALKDSNVRKYILGGDEADRRSSERRCSHA